MNAPTSLRPAPDRRPLFWGVRGWHATIAVAALAMFLGVGTRAVRLPATVDRVALVNPSDFALHVDVGDGDDGGSLALGTAEPRATTVVERVLHRGDVWVFRFHGQGVDVGEIRVPEAVLDRASWRFEIPPEVPDRLVAAGVPPTP